MRKIKAAAIQPKYLVAAGQYNCLSEEYKNIPDEIVENHLTAQMDVTLRLLEKAGGEGCDIVTTCEDITGVGPYIVDITDKNIFPELVQKTYPMIEAKLAETARKYSMYIVACYYKYINDEIFNTATIFDRKGNIHGQYCKTQLPPDEKWQVTEGESLDVFELDFGKIGILICYDMMFQECANVLALKGAEILFHPTVGYGWYDSIGEAAIRTRANDNSVYIVTSKNYVFNHAGNSSIVDYWGQVLADAGFYDDTIVFREINLDERKLQPPWYNPTHMSGTQDMRKRQLQERRPEIYSTISAPSKDRFRVPSKEVQLSIIDKIKNGECHW